jgi:hypothetical protein
VSKPRGSIDRKSVHISNIDRLAIVEPQELPRSPEPILESRSVEIELSSY